MYVPWSSSMKDNDPNSDNDKSKTSSFPSFPDAIKHVERNQKYNQRKCLLYNTLGFFMLAILLALTFTFIFIFIIKKHTTTNTGSRPPSTPEKGCPDILNRSSWNARPYTSRENLTTSPVTHIVIHELPGFNSNMSQQGCIKYMKETQDLHVDKFYWADIGYNFILCDDDNDDQQQIYTGRGWKYVGAHCKSYNDKSLGIVIMGNYTNIKSLNTFKSLIQCGIKNNDIIRNFTLVGHKNSEKIYEYYLEYFRNDIDLQYSNQVNGKQKFCS